jgi:hypothetical protein
VITHELKIWRAYFLEIARGAKTLEIRFGEDRDYLVGDHILYREWEHGAAAYTGRWLMARVAACACVDPARFGGRGERTWALQLTEVGPIREGVAPSAVPTRLDLGLAPAGVATFEGWEAWEAWIPVGGIHFAEVPLMGPTRSAGQRCVTLHRIPHGAADAALEAWAQESLAAGAAGRLCVLRMRRGLVEGPQDQQIHALTYAHVVRAKRGSGDLLFSEVDILGVVPEGAVS